MRLPYPEYAPNMIDGSPWGHGSIRARPTEAGERCPLCNRRYLKSERALVWIDGDEACWRCGKAWVASVRDQWAHLVPRRRVAADKEIEPLGTAAFPGQLQLAISA